MANEQENNQVVQDDPIVATTVEQDALSLEQPQEEGVEASTSVDWEAETKKFQSMYDKKTADFENLNSESQELIRLKNLLDSRPDVVEAMESAMQGKSEKVKEKDLDPESFDPWDAYYKPDSASYKMRVTREKELVHQTVDQELGKLQEAMAVNNLKNELQSRHKLSQHEAEEFLNFATTPRGDLPLDTLIKVWKEKDGGKVQNVNKEAVEKAQNIPQPAGVLQGGEPPKKNDQDQMWDRIMNAGSRGKIAK